MRDIESAYAAGVDEAMRDIADGRPKLRYGARGAWGDDLRQTLHARFSVELILLSCLTDEVSQAFESGYNTTIEAHIDERYGQGSIAQVLDEVQQRRKAAYDRWTAKRDTQ